MPVKDMMTRNDKTSRSAGRPTLRRAAAFLGITVVALGIIIIALSRRGDTGRPSSADSLIAAVRIADRQIDSLLLCGDRNDDTGDLQHREAAVLLLHRDSLAAAAGLSCRDTILTRRVAQALERDTAILQAKCYLFADMPRLHADLLGRLQDIRQTLDIIVQCK